MQISIIDLDIGNVDSIANMLNKLGAQSTIINTPEQVMLAEKLILPGIGSYDAGMDSIAGLGLTDSIREAANVKGTPIIGICLGAQLMLKSSAEGEKSGLGLVDGFCKKFDFDQSGGLKIPHMGWSKVRPMKNSPLISGLDENETEFYFVHSYHFVLQDDSMTLLNTNYGYEFCSAFAQKNIYGVQFHPEKSHRHGMQLLKNFVNL